MLREIVLPSFGSSVGEATLVEWLVEIGAEVQAGQVIAEIETDKAMAELEASESGVIETIEVPAGSEGVEVGTVLARLKVAHGTETVAPSNETTPGTADLPDDPGDGPAPRPGADPEIRPARAVEKPPEDDASERLKASPYARKLAAERGIDLHGIPGSGPGGRVVSLDLETKRAPQRPSSPGSLEAMGYGTDSYELLPLSKMRRAIAASLTASVRDIPHFSLTCDLEMDDVLKDRQVRNLKATASDGTISINDYLVWACAQALKDVPEANCSYTEEGIVRHRNANIAVAVAIDEGLIAPVITAAEERRLEAIATATRDLAKRARAAQINTRELQGATFTVSNLGMMGIRSFTSILSQPQACILSVGVAEQRPVARKGRVAVASQATCTLTCDHRVVDGAIGARFLQALRDRLAGPFD